MSRQEFRTKPGTARWKELVETRCVAKRQFMTKEAAERFIRQRKPEYGNDARSAYECPMCGLWHTSKQEPDSG